MRESIEHEQAVMKTGGIKGVIKEMMMKGNRNRLGMGVAIMWFQNLSGIVRRPLTSLSWPTLNLVSRTRSTSESPPSEPAREPMLTLDRSYSPSIFGSLGITDSLLATGLYGVVKAIASIIFLVRSSTSPRRGCRLTWRRRSSSSTGSSDGMPSWSARASRPSPCSTSRSTSSVSSL